MFATRMVSYLKTRQTDKQLDKTRYESVLHVLILLLHLKFSVGLGHMQPLERLATMFPHPVLAQIEAVLGNIGAVRATEARLDAAFVLEVALQVAFLYVGLVAADCRTLILTSSHKFGILGVRVDRLEGVGFVTSTISSPH